MDDETNSSYSEISGDNSSDCGAFAATNNGSANIDKTNGTGSTSQATSTMTVLVYWAPTNKRTCVCVMRMTNIIFWIYHNQGIDDSLLNFISNIKIDQKLNFWFDGKISRKGKSSERWKRWATNGSRLSSWSSNANGQKSCAIWSAVWAYIWRQKELFRIHWSWKVLDMKWNKMLVWKRFIAVATANCVELRALPKFIRFPIHHLKTQNSNYIEETLNTIMIALRIRFRKCPMNCQSLWQLRIWMSSVQMKSKKQKRDEDISARTSSKSICSQFSGAKNDDLFCQ